MSRDRDYVSRYLSDRLAPLRWPERAEPWQCGQARYRRHIRNVGGPAALAYAMRTALSELDTALLWGSAEEISHRVRDIIQLKLP